MTGESPTDREFGLVRGKVFPADQARSLLNPARRLVQLARRTVTAMQLAPDGHLVLADLQAEMLRVASTRLRDLTNVSWVRAVTIAETRRDSDFIPLRELRDRAPTRVPGPSRNRVAIRSSGSGERPEVPGYNFRK